MAEPAWTGLLLSGVAEIAAELTRSCDGLRRNADPESLHDGRKSSRRLRLVLRLLHSVVSHRDGNRWRKRLKSFRNALSEARDLDVQSAIFERMAGAGEGGAAEVLGVLRSRRASLQDHIVLEAVGLLDDGLPETVQKRIARRLSAPRRVRMGLTRESVSEDMGRRTLRLADKMASRLPALYRDEDPGTHHRVRIATRKLRYALEFLHRTGEEPLEERVECVLALQTGLGHLQDAHVMRRTLDGLDRAGLLPETAAGLRKTAEARCRSALDLSRERARIVGEYGWLAGLRNALGSFSLGGKRSR